MNNIGIVGGVGPYAGVDLHSKIIKNTIAESDQDHLTVYHISNSREIEDRTKYYFDTSLRNPAQDIFNVIQQLAYFQCKVIGISCNSSHIVSIREVLDKLVYDTYGDSIQVLHMIQETGKALAMKGVKKVGLLATRSTCLSLLYQTVFKEFDIEVIIPNSEERILRVHDSIYNAVYGIKTQFAPVHATAKKILLEEANNLLHFRVEGIIMGCTEIPLALTQDTMPIPLFDATEILARALINISDPKKLVENHTIL